MWSIADQCLGVCGDRFGRLTIRQFQALHDRFEERERRMDRRFGMLMSLYQSTHLKEGAEVKQPEEWFKSAEPDYEMTPEETIAAARGMFDPSAAKAKAVRNARQRIA